MNCAVPDKLRAAFAGLALAACLGASAAELEICYDYGCYRQARVVFADADLAALRAMLEPAVDAAGERALLAQAVGRMYALAALQSPIWRDRARNSMDERHLDGAMDCIDHSTNTDRFLRLLDSAGALRFHMVGPRSRRFTFLIFAEHWTATLVAAQGAERFAVDSWFFEPGAPALVVTLERWQAGYDPASELKAAQ